MLYLRILLNSRITPILFQFLIGNYYFCCKKQSTSTSSDASLAQSRQNIEAEIKQGIYEFSYFQLGALAATFELRRFLMPSSIIDRGLTGVSLIVNGYTAI